MTCPTTGYTGQNFCDKGSRFGKPTGLAFAIDGHTNSAADFLLQSELENDVQAQQVFPLHEMKGFEDLSTEAQYQDYEDGTRKLLEQGNYRFAAHFDLNECTKKQLLNFRGFGEGLYMHYGDVRRGRTIDAGTNVVPIRIDKVNIEKATLPNMTEGEMIKVVVDLKSDKDLNEYDHSRKMAWDLDDVDGLTEVGLAVTAGATATTIVVTVTSDCGDNTKQISGLGLTSADWTIGTGSVTSAVESATTRGEYTITGVGMAGDVNLASPTLRSDTVMAISSGAVASGI